MAWASISVDFTMFQKSFIFRCDTSSMMTYNDESHYTINALAVLGQVANGGAKHLEEQLTCLQVPSVTKATFIL